MSNQLSVPVLLGRDVLELPQKPRTQNTTLDPDREMGWMTTTWSQWKEQTKQESEDHQAEANNTVLPANNEKLTNSVTLNCEDTNESMRSFFKVARFAKNCQRSRSEKMAFKDSKCKSNNRWTFRVSGFSGMEWWTGTVEWNGGLERWNGGLERWNGGLERWNGGLERWNGTRSLFTPQLGGSALYNIIIISDFNVLTFN